MQRMHKGLVSRKLTVMVLALGLVGLLGCAGRQRPRPPVVVTSAASDEYTKAEYDRDRQAYEAAVTDRNWPEATRLRNVIIDRIMVDMEFAYREFETKLFTSRATDQVAGDFVELATTASIGIVRGERVKDILAISLTAFKGGRLSIDKNFFREKTIDVIIQRMRAERDVVKKRIKESAAYMDARGYPFEQARLDLIELYYAGTLAGALVALVNDTGQHAQEAKEKLKKAEDEIIQLKSIPTRQQVEDITRIRERLDLWTEAICEDPSCSRTKSGAEAQEAEGKARKALIALGERVPTTMSVKEVLEELLDKLRAAARLEGQEKTEYYGRLKKAFGLED